MKIDEARDFMVGNSAVQGLYVGETLVWPMEFDYVITNVVLVYSAGGSQIPASGGYAYFTGRVMQYLRGRPYKDLGTKTLTPHILSGDTSYFSIDGTQVKAASRGKTEGTSKSVSVGYSYGTSDVSVGWPVYLQENAKEQTSQTRTTTAYAINLASAFINGGGGNIALSGTRTYTQVTKYTYTSGATDTVTETGKTVSQLPTSVTFDTQTGISYSGGNIVVGVNGRNTNTRSWRVTGTYDGFSNYKDLMQGADSYTDTDVSSDYYAKLTVIGGSIHAWESSATINISAGHTVTTFRNWVYGEDEHLNPHVVPDTPSLVKTGDTYKTFTVSGNVLTHASMGTNVRTESCTISIENGGKSDSLYFSATNKLERTDFVSAVLTLSPDTSFILCTDTSVNVTAYITRNLNKVFTSTATEPTTDHSGTMTLKYGSNTQNITNNQSVSVTVGNNKHTLESRQIGMSLEYINGETYSTTATVYQGGDATYTRDVSYDPHFIVTVIQENVTASGGYAEYNILSYHRERTDTYWYSDDALKEQGVPASVDDGYDVSHTTTSYFSGEKKSGGVYRIEHDNMLKREATDSVTYTFSSRGYSESKTLSAKNVKSQKSQTKATTGYSISLSSLAVNPNANTITLSGTRTYSLITEYEWTSKETETVTETGKTESRLPSSVAFDTQTGVSYSGGTISITNNHRNTSVRTWKITGTYDGHTSGEKTFSQQGDSYTDTLRKYDYYADISVASGQAYAYASDIYLAISAGHTEDTYRNWTYGEDEYLNKQYKTDSVTPTESGDTHNRFSLSGSVVHHASMGKNETTDYVKYTLTNGGVSNYIELSATNTKWSYVSDKEYGSPWTSQRDETRNYTVSITANRYTSSSSPCPASGGTCTITTSASHEKRTVTTTHTPWTKYNITEWDSGSWESSVHSTGEDTSDNPGAWSTVSDTPSISLPAFATRSGNTITIASEGTSDLPDGRTGTVTAAVYNGSGSEMASESITLWQAANVVVPGVEEYISGLAIQSGYSSTIPGAGGTSYFNAWSYNQRQDHWSSGSPAGSPVKTAVYSAISVSSAGGSATVSPVSIQTTTEREVTLTVGKNPYGSQKSITVQLKVSGVVKQTLTFTQEATPAVITSISASPASIDFNVTYQQRVTITATYSDGTTAVLGSSQCSVASKPDWVGVADNTMLYVTTQPQHRYGSVNFWLNSDHTKTTSVSVTG